MLPMRSEQADRDNRVHRGLSVLAICMLALLPAQAAQADCLAAAAGAERRHGIPAGLLQAMARVETGNQPWALNAAGEPRLHASRAAALADLHALVAAGVRPIDVGCLQVSLFHHPGAFASLEEALDPVRNADYAARYLRRLFEQSRDWRVAVARYHSGDSERGGRYRLRVEAAQLGSVLARRPAFTPQAARAEALRLLESRLAAIGRRRILPPPPRPAALPPLIERF